MNTLFYVYVIGIVLNFCFFLFLCSLGGKQSDRWKPYVYCLIWPIILPFFLYRMIR